MKVKMRYLPFASVSWLFLSSLNVVAALVTALQFCCNTKVTKPPAVGMYSLLRIWSVCRSLRLRCRELLYAKLRRWKKRSSEE